MKSWKTTPYWYLDLFFVHIFEFCVRCSEGGRKSLVFIVLCSQRVYNLEILLWKFDILRTAFLSVAPTRCCEIYSGGLYSSIEKIEKCGWNWDIYSSKFFFLIASIFLFDLLALKRYCSRVCLYIFLKSIPSTIFCFPKILQNIEYYLFTLVRIRFIIFCAIWFRRWWKEERMKRKSTKLLFARNLVISFANCG